MFSRHHRATTGCCPAPSRPSATVGHIVVASGDQDQRVELRNALEFEGHEVAEAENVDQIRQTTCSGLHDILIVDASLDAVKLCRTIRPESDLGIIVLAGQDTQQGRIDALNSGADDFIPAPFILPELMARLRAILRRVVRSGKVRQIVLGDREVDLKSHEIKGPGSQVSHLTPKEFLVLQYLIAHANQARTPQTLAQSIWQRDGEGELEYVRVIIRQLRHKLEAAPDNPRYILTERSAGYRFQMPS
jgi:two-component system KDP operon response regulator KdpE